MDANDLIGLAQKSRYLRAVDVGESLKVTIANVTVDTMKAKGEEEKERGVVWFDEDERGLVVNVSLGQILRAMFGLNLQDWAGKRLELYNDTTVRGKSGKAVGGIRIKSSPDIRQDVVVLAGQSPFSRGTEYTIKAASTQTASDTDSVGDGDPLRRALREHQLTVADFNQWAAANGKPSVDKFHQRGRDQAASWISGIGHTVVRDFVTTSANDSDDPMAV